MTEKHFHTFIFPGCKTNPSRDRGGILKSMEEGGILAPYYPIGGSVWITKQRNKDSRNTFLNTTISAYSKSVMDLYKDSTHILIRLLDVLEWFQLS